VSHVLRLMATLVELGRVLAVLPWVEMARRRRGLKPVVARLRDTSWKLWQRPPHARVHLRRAIAWVDHFMPGGGNCYRRVLLEMALDRGAAAEPVCMGFHALGPRLKGHVWLADRSGSSEPFQVTVRL
jgi:hypothetical protein